MKVVQLPKFLHLTVQKKNGVLDIAFRQKRDAEPDLVSLTTEQVEAIEWLLSTMKKVESGSLSITIGG